MSLKHLLILLRFFWAQKPSQYDGHGQSVCTIPWPPKTSPTLKNSQWCPWRQFSKLDGFYTVEKSIYSNIAFLLPAKTLRKVSCSFFSQCVNNCFRTQWCVNTYLCTQQCVYNYCAILCKYRAFKKKRYNFWVSLSRLKRWLESLDHILLNTVIHSFVLNIDNFQLNIWKPRYWSPKFDYQDW